MSIPAAFLEELRGRTDLPALIGRTTKITRAGRDWKGCCPFHNEKSPSFHVYADHYHCFGCGAHGDGLSWLIDKGGLTFPDAVRELAAAAGMEVPAATPEARAKAERAATLRDAVEAAARWFSERLWGAEGGDARAYLARRGVSDETARAFALGFAPAGGGLRRSLAAMGDALLTEAGLLGAGEGGTYERFRSRLIFPIRDARGRAIGFGGRALGDAQPKYLNSPDTPLFDKGRTLWNLDRAAGPARARGRLFVVEGYMDAIALAQAGIGEAVAPMGTALTEAQLALAWRLVPEPVLCFDGDRAGARAAAKAMARALPGLAPGRSLRFVALPEGQDPDDLVREGGAAAFEVLAAAAEPLHEALWREMIAAADTTTPEGRAGAKAALLAAAATIGDAEVRAQYEGLMRERFWQAFGWRKPGEGARPMALVPVRRGARRLEERAHAVLLGLLAHPAVASDLSEAVAALPIASSRLLRLRNAIVDAVMWTPDIDADALTARLAAEGLTDDLAWLRDHGRLSFSFTSLTSDPARARAQLAHALETLAALERNYAARLAVAHAMRSDVANETPAEMLQSVGGPLSHGLLALERERKAALDALYDFAQDVGPDPALRPYLPLAGTDTQDGEDQRFDDGNGRQARSGGRAVDRSQRGLDQETDRARQEARLHHL